MYFIDDCNWLSNQKFDFFTLFYDYFH
jgi:hypothetical protein